MSDETRERFKPHEIRFQQWKLDEAPELFVLVRTVNGAPTHTLQADGTWVEPAEGTSFADMIEQQYDAMDLPQWGDME